MAGTGLVMLLYVLVNVAYLAAVPSSQLSGVKEIGAVAAQALLGKGAGGLFNVLVAVCLLSSLGAMLLTGPRVYCAMAGDGLSLRVLGRIVPRSGVPANAVWLQAGIAALDDRDGLFRNAPVLYRVYPLPFRGAECFGTHGAPASPGSARLLPHAVLPLGPASLYRRQRLDYHLLPGRQSVAGPCPQPLLWRWVWSSTKYGPVRIRANRCIPHPRRLPDEPLMRVEGRTVYKLKDFMPNVK